jgi:catechol 2,3-dioxygenase-like lactoylglutathione lyase family enzyme
MPRNGVLMQRTMMPELSIVQLALTSSDLPGSLRLYSELFGFANAGCRAIWGPSMRIQGLDASARGLMWWMVGRDAFFQLEIFQHTNPAQRPLRPDWRPCDHGWVRFGVAVSDFGRSRQVLERWGLRPSGPERTVRELRRVGFRDPFVGVMVEILEKGTTFSDDARTGGRDLDPSLVYVTSSVSDLPAARSFYENMLGLAIEPLDTADDSAREASRGLAGASREGFVVRLGSRCLEIVCYQEPKGRPRRADHSVADQGIMNVGIGCRQPEAMRKVIASVRDAGLEVTDTLGGDEGLASYILDAEREIELLAIPEATEPWVGFRPAEPFASA